MTGEFALRGHTADVAVEATGGSPGAVFAAVADGLAAAQCEDVPGSGGERFDVERTAADLEGLLYDYLGRLIYERDVRGVLPVDNEATVTLPEHHGGSDAAERADGEPDGSGRDVDGDAYQVVASARGVPLTDVDAGEVKAVTFSEMVVEARETGWYAYVVFDV